MKVFLTILTVVVLIVLALIVGNLDNEPDVASNPDNNADEERDAQVYRDGDIAQQFKLDNLSAMDTLAAGYVVKGMVPGNWFFEATAPYVVTDWDGRIIGEGFIQATDEWMTTDPVPFVGGVAYELDSTVGNTRGAIIFKRANASGLPENDQSVELPVELRYTD